MSQTRKLQRWIDLLAALLPRRFPAAFEELCRDVPAYAEAGQTDDARRRMFERDKEELRAFGIPIETVEHDDGEAAGYRLRSRDFYLPYLALRADERPRAPRRLDRYGYASLPSLTFGAEELAAVVEAAARLRDLGDPFLAEHADSAIRKLACDLPVDVGAAGATRLVPPRTRTAPELLAMLGEALRRRKLISFEYQTMGSDAPARRTVEPFGLFFLSQHWYLAARASGEETVKNYRLGRIGVAEMNRRKPGSADYEIPAEFDLGEHARSRQAWELGAGDAVDAVVALRSEAGAARAAHRLGEEVPGRPGHRRFRVRRVDAFARWLLSFAGDLEPVSPAAVVEEYRGLARETLAHHETARPPADPPDCHV